jgi:hypothetical protein
MNLRDRDHFTMSVPPFAQSLGLKAQLSKSCCASYYWNPRNLERPWNLTLCQLTEGFDNMIVIPQYPLWYIPDGDSDGEEQSLGTGDRVDGIVEDCDAVDQESKGSEDRNRPA